MNTSFYSKIFVLMFLNVYLHSSEPKKITLGTTEWCPYTCRDISGNGIVGQFIDEIAQKNNYDLKVNFLPWNRAVAEANSGRIDGLLTAVKSEAPNLYFTSTPTMKYKACAFSIEDRPLITKEELLKKKIAIIDAYSYGDFFDDLLKDGKADIVRIRGEKPLKRIFEIIRLKRADYFIESSKVAYFHLGKQIYQNLCGEDNPFYLAVNPGKPEAIEFVKMLNKEIKNNQAILDSILKNFYEKYAK